MIYPHKWTTAHGYVVCLCSTIGPMVDVGNEKSLVLQPKMKERFSEVFATKTRDEWTVIFKGSSKFTIVLLYTCMVIMQTLMLVLSLSSH